MMKGQFQAMADLTQ